MVNGKTVEGDKKVYCSAGMNYVFIYPNGDVYRCISDYSYQYSPLFNVKRGWGTINKPLLCHHDKCESDCDLNWATKWIVKEDKEGKAQIVKSRFNHPVPIEESLFPQQTVLKKQENSIHIAWVPTSRCNYNCKYCAATFDKNRNWCPSSYPELSTSEWFIIWEEIYNRYTHASVSVTGGEPLLSKATLPILVMISDKFAIDITSNLSINTNVMGIVRNGIKPGIDKGIRFITGSLHPTAQVFNKDFFFGSLLYLKNHGFDVGVNFVGYPLQLFLATEYKEICDKYGIHFELGVWVGSDNNGFKPRYTEIEKKYVDKITGMHCKLEQNAIKFRNFNYVILTDMTKIEIEEGEIVTMYANIKNTGDCVWLNKEREIYKIGAKVVRYGDEEYILKEFRADFSRSSIKPGELCNFDIKIDTRGLMRGVYLLKIDVIKERSFWFEDKGAEPLRLKLNILESSFKSEIMELNFPEIVSRNTKVISKMKIKNIGKAGWNPRDKEFNIKAGCRMYKDDNLLRTVPVREFRVDLSNEIKFSEILEIEMEFNFSGLMSGKYMLIFDMVNEDKFWFEERGSKKYVKKITLLN